MNLAPLWKKLANTSPFLIGIYWGFGLFVATFLLIVFRKGDLHELGVPILLTGAVATILAGTVVMGVVYSELQKTRAQLALQLERFQNFESEAEHRARHDPLTGLPGRWMAKTLGEKLLSRARHSKLAAALLFIDVIDFRALNAGLGEKGGDDLLRHIASILQLYVRAGDAVCRPHGDQFVVVLVDIGSADVAYGCASRFMEAMRKEVMVNGMRVAPTFGIGISMLGNDGDSFDDLLSKSAMACAHAKRVGSGTIRFFDADMNLNMLEGINLLSALRWACERNELVLHYQPFFALKTGALSGCEALIRWNHPDKGLIPPVQFLRIAEKSGLIGDIGTWCIRQVCAQLKEWQSGPLADASISVNLSMSQFQRGNLEHVVMNALNDFNVNPAKLEFEVTEAMLASDPQALAGPIRALKNLGVRFALDDFGTGYSSLTQLQRFSIDRLKIEASFVSQIQSNPQQLAFVKVMIDMAKSLGILVTAEGIESQETLRLLTDLGCDFGYGFYCGAPVPAQDIQGVNSLSRS